MCKLSTVGQCKPLAWKRMVPAQTAISSVIVAKFAKYKMCKVIKIKICTEWAYKILNIKICKFAECLFSIFLEDRWSKSIEWKRMIPAQTALSSIQRVEWMKYCSYQISNSVIIKCQTLLARGLNISNIVVQMSS